MHLALDPTALRQALADLGHEAVALHSAAAEYDWRAIDPTIFGTLFENGLESDERSQLGANYTDTNTIQKIITPLINEPLLAEWPQADEIVEIGRAHDLTPVTLIKRA